MSALPYQLLGSLLGGQQPPAQQPPPQQQPPPKQKASPKSTRAEKPEITLTVRPDQPPQTPGAQPPPQVAPPATAAPPAVPPKPAGATPPAAASAQAQVPASAPPGAPGTPSSPTVDSLRAAATSAETDYEKAAQDLLNHPEGQATIHPPNKWAMLGAVLLGLVGGPAGAALGGGFIQGSVAGAQARYAREQAALEHDETSREKRVTALGTIADRKAGLVNQAEGLQEKASEFATRHGEFLDKLETQSAEFQQTFGLKSKLATAQIKHWQDQIATMVSRNAITEYDAQLASQTRLQVAAITQSGLDRRFAGNAELRSYLAQATGAQRTLDDQIRTINAQVQGGQLDPATAQGMAATAVAAAHSAVEDALDKAGRVDPRLNAAATAGAPLTTQGGGGFGAPSAPGGATGGSDLVQAGAAAYAQGEAAAGRNVVPGATTDPNGYTYPANLNHATDPQAPLQTPVGQLIAKPQERHGAIVQSMQATGVGQGPGMAPNDYKTVTSWIETTTSQNKDALGKSLDEFYAGLHAQYPTMNATQAEQAGDAWLHSLALASVKDGSGTHHDPNAAHASGANVQFAIPPNKQKPYEALIQYFRTQATQEMQADPQVLGKMDPFDPKDADKKARAILGLPIPPEAENPVASFFKSVFGGRDQPQEPDRLDMLHKAGLTDEQIRELPGGDQLLHHKSNTLTAPTPAPTHAQLGRMPLTQSIQAIAKETPGLGAMGAPLLAAIIENESSGNPGARSPVGAIGYGQLMPGTAESLGVDPKDAVSNIRGSATYLAGLLKRFHSIPLAVAAYNAGPQAVVDHHYRIPPYAETQAYVGKVLASYRKIIGAPSP